MTLVIPKSPAPDRPATAAGARDTPLPGISFQLSPGFHLPAQVTDENEAMDAPKAPAAERAALPDSTSPPRHALDSGFYEDDAVSDSLHLWSDMSDDDVVVGGKPYVASADAVDRDRPHAYNGHPQPPVGTRLEQVLVYLRSQDPATDRHWHIRAAAIEAYLDFVEGGPAANAAPAPTTIGPEAAQLADQQASLDAALERVETDEHFARAEMDGRAVDADSIAYYNAIHAAPPPPPPLLGARTRAIFDEARRRLADHRAFLGRRQEQEQEQASAPDGAGFLQSLLATTGRSFAARMAVNAAAEARVRFDEDYFPGQAARFRREAERHKHHSNKDDYLFDSEHALLEGTPLAKLETHPFTVQMARFRRFRQHYMEEARILAEQAHGSDRGWATLPPSDGVYSLGYSKVDVALSTTTTTTTTTRSPRLVPRQPLPPHMERDRQLLQLLRGLSRRLVRRLDTAPRPLLADVAAYVEQGLHGLPAPQSGLVLRDEFDLDLDHLGDRSAALRPLAETEARWLQFLLSDSTNEQLAAPLPRGPYMEEDASIADPADPAAAQSKANEEGSCALYHAFAHRFQALLDADAANPNGLFSAADRPVLVADVVHAINRQSGSAFSLYDGLHFLSRLSRAGRCRFQHVPASRDHGAVQRPLLTIHPEHRIHAPSSAPRVPEDVEDEDDAIGAPRRRTEVDATWDDTIARAPRAVPATVRQFFCCLGFRLGHTLRTLETRGRAQWTAYLDEQDTQPAGEAMRRSLRVWEQTYRQLVNDSGALDEASAGGIPTSFKDVIRLADEKSFMALNDSDDVHPSVRTKRRRRRNRADGAFTEEAARAYVCRQLIAEAAQGRDAPINAVTNPVSRGVWDWAQPEIVGEAPPHFFHMDRWPLHLQTKATAAHVSDGARIAMDPEILWDPASEDPTPAGYLWSVSTADRRYGFRRIEAAETQYMLGDTALQRQVVVRDITRRVAAAIGVDVDELAEGGTSRTTQGLFGWLGSKLGKRKRDEAGESDSEGVDVIDFAVTELPKVQDVPRSLDWTEMYTGSEADGEDDEDRKDDTVGLGVEAGDEAGLEAAEAWTDEDDRALVRAIYAARG